MKHTVKICKEMKISKPISKNIVNYIKRFFRRPISIQPLPANKKFVKHSIVVPTTVQGDLDNFKLKYPDLSMPDMIQRIIWAQYQREQIPIYKEPDISHKQEKPVFDRPKQEVFYRQLQKVFSDNTISLAEASTGIGKSRVINQIAKEQTDKGNQVVVASPTLQVLSQLIKEWKDIHQTSINFVIGKGQFVSLQKVEEWIKDENIQEVDPKIEDQILQDKQNVLEWIKNGGKNTCEATKIFHDHHKDLAWLAEDMEAIAPTAPVNSLLLNGDKNREEKDIAELVHENLINKSQIEKNKPVFTTHSALVWDQKLQKMNSKNILPLDSTHLIIDEAHLFSSIVESAHSTSLSLRGLLFALKKNTAIWKQAKKTTKAKEAIREVQKMLNVLKNFKHIEKFNLNNEDLNPDIKQEIVNSGLNLLKKLKPLENVNSTINNAIDALYGMTQETFGTHIEYSPKRKYPSITTGPRSLKSFFENFWSKWTTAALISATIYIPLKEGRLSSSMIRVPLHLFDVAELPPVYANWVYDPEMKIITKNENIVPPQESKYKNKSREEFEQDIQTWFNLVAEKIKEIKKQAKGGILILLPGYEYIYNIAERLTDLDCLIAQKHGGYKLAKNKFLECYECGVHGTWLATGPAWTGLDLTDKKQPAEKDFLLTDLVIPRIPFGVERTSIFQARQIWFKNNERSRVAFQIKQGIGRLMRREGLKDRKIWFLDGRIHNAGQTHMTSPVVEILTQYQN